MRSKDATEPTPATPAITVKGPVAPLAVKFVAVATPEPSVTAVAEVEPPKVADAPDEGATNVTTTPLIGLALPLRTSARSGEANVLFTTALWGAPDTGLTLAGAPGPAA